MKINEVVSNRNLAFYERYDLFHYYSDYLSSEAEMYQHLTSNWEFQKLKEIVDNRSIGKILLIGLGFGRELDHLLKLHPNFEISVIDFNRQFIEPAENIYSNARVSFHRVDLNTEVIPFKNDTFDLIIALNTLEYLDELAYSSFFVEARRVLSKGGILFFRLYNSSFPFYIFDKRQLRKRHANQPMLYPRPFLQTFDIVEKSLNISALFPVSMRIIFRPFNFLYGNSLAYITWLLERIVCAIIPIKYARNVYFVGRKP